MKLKPDPIMRELMQFAAAHVASEMRFIVRVDVPGGIDASKLGEEPTAETPLATISGRDVLRPERKRELLVVPVSQVLLSRMGGKAKAYFKARFADGSLELVDPVVDQGW